MPRKLPGPCFLILLFLFLSTITQAQWTTSSLSQGREHMGSTTVGSKIFFAGGISSIAHSVVDIYDNIANTWTTSGLSQARFNLSATSVGTKAFFAGGYTLSGPSNVIDIYDASSGSWSTHTLSEAKFRMAAASVGTKVLFAGGTNGSGQFYSTVDIYDNNTNTWSTASLSQSRAYLGATTLGTKVYFAGGFTGTGYSNRVDIYDNSNQSWTTASLSEARAEVAMASVGTKVLIAGGELSNGASSDVVDIYDNSSANWTTAKLSLKRARISAAAVSNAVFFAGGDPGIGASYVVDVYLNETGAWKTSDLSVWGSALAGASQGSKVFFAGNVSMTPVVDIYDTSCASSPQISVSPSTATMSIGKSASLTASGNAVYGWTYTWDPSTGLSTTSGNNVLASPLSTTTYLVTGSTLTNCINSKSASVTVLESEVLLYPNPVDQLLSINYQYFDIDQKIEITILDPLARPVVQISLLPAELLDIADLAPGLYFLQAQQTNKSLTTKFIKK